MKTTRFACRSALVFALLTTGAALVGHAHVAHAANCGGYYCDNQWPDQQGCQGDQQIVTQTSLYDQGHTYRGERLVLRSAACNATWVQINPAGAGSGSAEMYMCNTTYNVCSDKNTAGYNNGTQRVWSRMVGLRDGNQNTEGHGAMYGSNPSYVAV